VCETGILASDATANDAAPPTFYVSSDYTTHANTQRRRFTLFLSFFLFFFVNSSRPHDTRFDNTRKRRRKKKKKVQTLPFLQNRKGKLNNVQSANNRSTGCRALLLLLLCCGGFYN